jgi:DNA-binding response OmpR family regulator
MDGFNPGEAMAAKILVIDDDPNVQRLLTYTLKQEGYEVSWRPTAPRASGCGARRFPR